MKFIHENTWVMDTEKSSLLVEKKTEIDGSPLMKNTRTVQYYLSPKTQHFFVVITDVYLGENKETLLSVFASKEECVASMLSEKIELETIIQIHGLQEG